jgi:hypothetical protein
MKTQALSARTERRGTPANVGSLRSTARKPFRSELTIRAKKSGFDRTN